MKQLLNEDKFFCPICNDEYTLSAYLKGVFNENEKVLWLANMVTHYRHNHITSWNKCWGNNGYKYRQGWFEDYEEEKQKVNERAKRQIFRKAKEYLIFHEFNLDDVKKLKSNDEATLQLFSKISKHK